MQLIQDTAEEYFKRPELSRTDIVALNKSYRTFYLKRHQSFLETEAMVIGSALHTQTLEPDKFEERFAIWEGPRRAGKEYSEFLVKNSSKSILRTRDMELLIKMVDEIRKYKIGEKLLECDQIEFSLYDPPREDFPGLRARIDAYSEDENCIYDLKSIHSSQQISQHFVKHGYHIQSWLYPYLLMKKYNLSLADEPRMIFIFISKDDLTVHLREASPEASRLGCQEIDRGIEIYTKNVNIFDIHQLEEPLVEQIGVPQWYKDHIVETHSLDF